MFDRIVLAVDGSEPSRRAQETAAKLAGPFPRTPSEAADLSPASWPSSSPTASAPAARRSAAISSHIAAFLVGFVDDKVVHHSRCSFLITR
jgi:nucleotide-binding universal stress UspA family protein